jgi:hypothetical protein
VLPLSAAKYPGTKKPKNLADANKDALRYNIIPALGFNEK